MEIAADRKFDWIAVLALASGAAVLIPSLAVVAVTLISVAMRLI
jgi:hypothetical protein